MERSSAFIAHPLWQMPCQPRPFTERSSSNPSITHGHLTFRTSRRYAWFVPHYRPPKEHAPPEQTGGVSPRNARRYRARLLRTRASAEVPKPMYPRKVRASVRTRSRTISIGTSFVPPRILPHKSTRTTRFGNPNAGSSMRIASTQSCSTRFCIRSTSSSDGGAPVNMLFRASCATSKDTRSPISFTRRFRSAVMTFTSQVVCQVVCKERSRKQCHISYTNATYLQHGRWSTNYHLNTGIQVVILSGARMEGGRARSALRYRFSMLARHGAARFFGLVGDRVNDSAK